MKKINPVYSADSVKAESASEMMNLGAAVAENTVPGMVIALTGSLGAGKTTFVKGIARGLEISDEITSPSFTIIKEYYDGRIPLFHMDLYRIDNHEELFMIGFEELIYGNGLSIIEWSEKAGELLPPTSIMVDIIINTDGSRTVNFKDS